MGKARYIYFSDEIDHRLNNEDNKSSLINRLLKEHYDKADFLNMNAEELKTELAVRKLQKKTDAEIKEMRNAK